MCLYVFVCVCVCVRVCERARERERERERGDSVRFWEKGEGQGAVGQVRGARGELAVLRFTVVVLAVLLSQHYASTGVVLARRAMQAEER